MRNDSRIPTNQPAQRSPRAISWKKKSREKIMKRRCLVCRDFFFQCYQGNVRLVKRKLSYALPVDDSRNSCSFLPSARLYGALRHPYVQLQCVKPQSELANPPAWARFQFRTTRLPNCASSPRLFRHAVMDALLSCQQIDRPCIRPRLCRG